MKKIKVLIVDDSIVAQNVLQVIFHQDPEIQVVGIASDPIIAHELLEKTNPDVMTLDVEMPRKDGITYLKELMQTHPMPVVMISALTEVGSSTTIEALTHGAVDYIEKPKSNDPVKFQVYAKRLISIIKVAAQANIKPLIYQDGNTFRPIPPVHAYNPAFLRDQIIVIGASTGGVEAIEKLLASFPENLILPGIMIVQHIQREFVAAFVRRINKICSSMAYETEQDLPIESGHIIVASAGTHLAINKRNGNYLCNLTNTPTVNDQRPAVDVLFDSVAALCGKKVIGVLLTGMGKDGAKGLKAIRDAGGETIAQDKESSIVWGMPGEAVKLDAAEHVLPLQDISEKTLAILNKRAEMSCRIK